MWKASASSEKESRTRKSTEPFRSRKKQRAACGCRRLFVVCGAPYCAAKQEGRASCLACCRNAPRSSFLYTFCICPAGGLVWQNVPIHFLRENTADMAENMGFSRSFLCAGKNFNVTFLLSNPEISAYPEHLRLPLSQTADIYSMRILRPRIAPTHHRRGNREAAYGQSETGIYARLSPQRVQPHPTVNTPDLRAAGTAVFHGRCNPISHSGRSPFSQQVHPFFHSGHSRISAADTANFYSGSRRPSPNRAGVATKARRRTKKQMPYRRKNRCVPHTDSRRPPYIRPVPPQRIQPVPVWAHPIFAARTGRRGCGRFLCGEALCPIDKTLFMIYNLF